MAMVFIDFFSILSMIVMEDVWLIEFSMVVIKGIIILEISMLRVIFFFAFLCIVFRHATTNIFISFVIPNCSTLFLDMHVMVVFGLYSNCICELFSFIAIFVVLMLLLFLHKAMGTIVLPNIWIIILFMIVGCGGGRILRKILG